MSRPGWARAIAVGAAALATLFSPRTLRADPIVGEASLAVAVGSTVSVDVGFARGLHCDDLSVVHAELRGVSPTSNRLFITGVRAGTTDCRAGTLGPPTVLVHITVK